jgi:uncharacterized membrane protein
MELEERLYAAMNLLFLPACTAVGLTARSMSGTNRMKSSTIRRWQWGIGLLFFVAGANHFLVPQPYLSMMPGYLPAHVLLVQLSGLAEMAGGIGVLFSATRRLAAWGLILLLVAVFPANLNVALHGWPGVDLPAWLLWVRLPLQVVFIWCVYRLCLCPNTKEATSLTQ